MNTLLEGKEGVSGGKLFRKEENLGPLSSPRSTDAPLSFRNSWVSQTGALTFFKLGVRRREMDLERICSPQAHQLPRLTSPPPTPIWGLFLLLGATGLPNSFCSVGGLLRRDKGRPSLVGELPGCSAVSCREELISFCRCFCCGQRRAEGRRPAGRGGGGRREAGGGGRHQQRLNAPASPGFITSQPPAKVRNAHLETG